MKNSSPTLAPESAELQALLGSDPTPPWWRRPALGFTLACLIVAAVGLWFWQSQARSEAALSYVTEPLRRGDLTLTVSANGTLQPTRTVQIGSELSGTVARVHVDVNDRVQAGQVLVELDPSRLADQVLRAQAALQVAQAQLTQAQASETEAQAQLARLDEVARLSQGQLPSAAELDAARAAYARARAARASALANVNAAQAALQSDQSQLSRASIRSPIDGVVLARSVDPGNAVAASLQAVTLLTIAQDLSQLRLDVNIDEADVAAVKAGQDASFTVSAHPGRRFPARVTRVAFGASRTDNVVSYTATLSVDNRDQRLRPGMSAVARITATERSDVLLVPNTALRFAPSSPPSEGGNGFIGRLLLSPPRVGAPKTVGTEPVGARSTRQIWLLQDGVPVPQVVKTGISDGRLTEVSGDALAPGLAVITDQRIGAAP
ncbi:efflux RND transporter periplasmic adaptor subunit [Hydrogenophaga sp.]|uniref:efflux RND transporter periplasmic adaptor subunit n=1 Tax=Hydrogenophaga sp. TaxID=1904254 RepID=UPI0019B01E6E|nr:efflux RND transporter periplasmic adaptor subunit [Hydrogenophaga sp.]MBD3893090.1 efflux RND transporter periplasmic adaptor subunit [Hydrogenophaga sp.]